MLRYGMTGELPAELSAGQHAKDLEGLARLRPCKFGIDGENSFSSFPRRFCALAIIKLASGLLTKLCMARISMQMC